MEQADTLLEDSVRSQLIPLAGMSLLLPTTCIAEVVNWETPQPVEGAPDWLLGTLDWRGLRIPLLSFEAANGRPAAEVTRHSRIVVLNGIGGDPALPFYALQMEGIPRLTVVDQAALGGDAEAEEALPLALTCILLQGEAVQIPDQDQLEAMLKALDISVASLDA